MTLLRTQPYLRPGASGGGGGGLYFRNPPDEFIGANVAACRTSRNTYFAANANSDDLGEFQGNQSLAIILNPTSGDTEYETYLPGDDVGDAYDATKWVDRTDAIVGRTGPTGPQSRIVLYAYINTATAPTVAPTGGTFVQSTGVKTVPTGYTATPVSPPTGQETYRAEAIVNPATDADTVNLAWSIPTLLPAYSAATLAEEAADEAAAARDLAQQYAGQAQDIPAGSPRGALVATSPTLPTASVGSNTVIAFGAAEIWTIEADAPDGFAAGETASNERLYLPDIHPAGSNGIWVVIEGGGVEVAEVFISQGGIQGATGADRRLVLPVSVTADALVRVGYWPRSGSTSGYIQITGNSDTLPANTVVKIYLAVVRGAGGGGGGGGGGLDQAAVDARVQAGVLDPAETANATAWGVAKGGTGATTAAAGLTALGGLTQAEVDARITLLAALLDGATFTGNVQGVTPADDDNSTSFATTGFVADGFDGASFSNLTRRLVLSRLGGGTAASLPLTFLNAFQGVDPIQAATYHQGDTVEVDDNIYIYTANVSASVATSAVPTDSRFRNLTEGGSTPVGNHSRYLALGADAVFTESDYTSGTEFMSDTVTFPTFLGHLFPGVVVPDTDPITTFTQLGVINQDISGFFMQIADIDIGGTTHNQWVGTQAFPDSYAGVQMRVS